MGGNESGKSTLLKGIQISLDREPIDNRLLNRRSRPDLEEPIFTSTFMLDEVDYEKLGHFAGFTDKIRWIEIKKFKSGALSFASFPVIHATRREIVKVKEKFLAVRKLFSNPIPMRSRAFIDVPLDSEDQAAIIKWFDESIERNSISNQEGRKILLSYMGKLDSITDKLGKADSDIVKDLNKYRLYVEFGRSIMSSSVSKKIAESLFTEMPSVLNYGENNRNVRFEYEISDINNENFLSNIFKATGESFDVINQEYEMDTHFALRRVSSRFNKMIEESWNDKDTRIDLILSGSTIKIYAHHQDGEDLSPITERSEGFRSFIALLAFVKANSNSLIKPIILIDEIESHLHYEAQASIIKFLSEQRIASKIIYSTHSPGCLPNNLNFMRAIEKEGVFSSINNRIWSSPSAGFNQMFWLMGASNFAYTARRSVVVCEGESDFIIFPVIFSEIDEFWRNQQFLPGFAKRKNPIELDEQSKQTLYLFDGDSDGAKYAREIVGLGINQENVFLLEEGCVLEDYIAKEVYVKAIIEEMRRSHGEGYVIDFESMPSKNRPNYIKEKCNELKIPAPSKRAIAERVAEISESEKIIMPEKAQYLESMSEKMKSRIVRNSVK